MLDLNRVICLCVSLGKQRRATAQDCLKHPWLQDKQEEVGPEQEEGGEAGASKIDCGAVEETRGSVALEHKSLPAAGV